MFGVQRYVCPVCSEEHVGGNRFATVVTLACEAVTPVGAPRYFPEWKPQPVIVLGAGLGVTEAPPQPETVTQRNERIAQLENQANERAQRIADAKREEDAVARLKKLEADEAKLKGRQSP